jgi:hypothetical protein
LGFDSNFERAGSVAGIDYDVYAKDAYGCIVNVPVTVLQMKNLLLQHQTLYVMTELYDFDYRTVDPAVGGAYTV